MLKAHPLLALSNCQKDDRYQYMGKKIPSSYIIYVMHSWCARTFGSVQVVFEYNNNNNNNNCANLLNIHLYVFI